MEAEQMLTELAAVEKEPELLSVMGGIITGTVPAFPMLRVECASHGDSHRKWECDDVRGYLRDEGKSTEADWWKEDGDCPGWRAKTLAEARLCLEELLVAEGLQVHPAWKNGKIHEWASWNTYPPFQKTVTGSTPTEAAIAATYEASKVKTDA